MSNTNINQNTRNDNNDDVIENRPTNSTIRRRVEKLFGPGSFKQGYTHSRRLSNASTASMSRASSTIRQSDSNVHPPRSMSAVKSIDLPVLRKLNEKFRAKLPAASLTPADIIHPSGKSASQKISSRDPEILQSQSMIIVSLKKSQPVLQPGTDTQQNVVHDAVELSEQNKGTECIYNRYEHYLNLAIDKEQMLIKLIKQTNSYLERLFVDRNISTEVIFFLKSANSKAQILIQEKLVPFKQLCLDALPSAHAEPLLFDRDTNINQLWEAICVDAINVASVFEEIEILRYNDWQVPEESRGFNHSLKEDKPTCSNDAATLHVSSDEPSQLD